jgi:hypothetical protein
MTHWNIEQVLAVGIVTWIWNNLGLDGKVVLIGNIVAAIALIVFTFLK